MDENYIKAQRSVSDNNIESHSSDPTSIGNGVEKADDGDTGEKGRQYNLRSRDRGWFYGHMLSHIVEGAEGNKSYNIQMLQASVGKSLRVENGFQFLHKAVEKIDESPKLMFDYILGHVFT